MCNEERKDLDQRDVAILDRIVEKYGGDLLLPPSFDTFNICIHTDDISDLTHIHESLFYEGFSFVQKINDNGSYIEILGAHCFSQKGA